MREEFLNKAKIYEPVLYERKCKVACNKRRLKNGDSICLDFKEHLVGYLSLHMEHSDLYPDAPVKLHIKFAESSYEMEYDFTDYKQQERGLSPNWLQEEIIYLDEPGVVELPRRYAFRYVKVEVVATNVPIDFLYFEVRAVTSANKEHAYSLTVDDVKLQKIDSIACNTLANCMQRVFEDGPKRDRRLWLGDLRIQALTDYYVFHNTNLVKKCLYLFGAFVEDGEVVASCVYENTREALPSVMQFEDYALLFVVCLYEYFLHTSDLELVKDLFGCAEKQLELACRNTENGIIKSGEAFIDWCDGLQKTTAHQGVLIYALDKMARLCDMTGLGNVAYWLEKNEIYSREAKAKLFNKEEGLFVNSYDNNQKSIHAQVWMVLADVLEEKEAKKLMECVISDDTLIAAVSPYMHHYVVEALMKVNMKQEAFDYIKRYWGQMVDLGADTFWEVFVPGDLSISPYGDPVMNSSCHAWSCSPAYFIRKYYNEDC